MPPTEIGDAVQWPRLDAAHPSDDGAASFADDSVAWILYNSLNHDSLGLSANPDAQQGLGSNAIPLSNAWPYAVSLYPNVETHTCKVTHHRQVQQSALHEETHLNGGRGLITGAVITPREVVSTHIHCDFKT